MSIPDSDLIYRYWGKARSHSDDIAVSYHLLPYHCLDVAAVGRVLLERHDALRSNLAQSLGIDEDTLFSWVLFFLALHDLGKFSEGFQSLRQDLFVKLRRCSAERPYTERHDSLGFVLWRKILWKTVWREDWLNLGSQAEDYRQEALCFWAGAVTGHHGRPPSVQGRHTSKIRVKTHFSENDQSAAVAFCREVRRLFLRGVSGAKQSPKEMLRTITRTSWLLAGVSVLCDWIGSDENHFPLVSEFIPLKDYWSSATEKARIALEAAGVLPIGPCRSTGTSALFPEIAGPSPLQQYVSSATLLGGPQLCILEDLTGSGKTEAALTLAHRFMDAGLADGVFVALPTMATANAMYDRLSEAYRRLFEEDSSPSLILSHSGRRLSSAFRRSILPGFGSSDARYGNREEQAEAVCAAWLADSRKKAFLADVGVGTVDQALLAVMPSRHQSLRLLGLSRKVLIVDEVHAYDPYMHSLLQNLLRFHAAFGGSAILLSATIPYRTRAELVASFSEGLGERPPLPADVSYPLATHLGRRGSREEPVAHRPDLRRTVRVEMIHEIENVCDRIVAAAGRGVCVCWIRNTVADALEAYELMQRQGVPADKLMLFHARFAMGDRLEKEGDVQKAFGSKSAAQDRAGRILIATQVVEQSLDLDFDVMISDLAPIDLLIQRAGRLLRHARDRFGNRLSATEGPDQRGEPCLAVYGPRPTENPDKDWYSKVFPKAAFVYENHGELWLTCRLLSQKGSWTMPDDARFLIEEVFAEQRPEIPEGLMEGELAADGRRRADYSLARLNMLKLNEGYAATVSQWMDDAATPTRVDENSVAVRLARWDGTKLGPWYDTGDHPWEMSQLSVRENLVKDEREPGDPTLRKAVVRAKADMPDRSKWSVLIPLEQRDADEWHGLALDRDGKTVAVIYSALTGFTISSDQNGAT